MFFGGEEQEDSAEGGEVRISANEESGKEEKEDKTKLEEEAESKLVGGSSSLPGTSSTSSSSTGSSDVNVEDVHRQNEKIIGLLEDIKSEISGGGNNQLL